MKFDKRHLIASLALLVGSIVYNVWVFTRPAADTRTGPVTSVAAVDAPAPSVPGGSIPATVDPAQVKPLPDVALDRSPEWPRDPFASLRQAPAIAQTDVPAPVQIEEPDPVVASILYSSDRRLAMIDGRVARIGDVVGGAKIIDILPNAVIIESPRRGQRTLTLRPSGAGATPR